MHYLKFGLSWTNFETSLRFEVFSSSLGRKQNIILFSLGPNFSLKSKSWPKAEHYIHCVTHHISCSSIAWADLAPPPPMWAKVDFWLHDTWSTYSRMSFLPKLTSLILTTPFHWINHHIECWLLWRNILLFKIRHNVYKLGSVQVSCHHVFHNYGPPPASAISAET